MSKFPPLSNASILEAEWENPSAWAEKLMQELAKNEQSRQGLYEELTSTLEQFKLDVELGKYDGATFVPHMSDDGWIWFTNDKGLENPEMKNFTGRDGTDGVCFPNEGYFSLGIENEHLFLYYNNYQAHPNFEIGKEDGHLYMLIDE